MTKNDMYLYEKLEKEEAVKLLAEMYKKKEGK